ncbi:ABC transporter ATP-binding protein [Mesorhizobium sp. BR1-1-16]|uniref:ABC transporter ATP-binding protein n=1 Tax=Mesorhizobium sp. BR1-1-16 TaxID=2876653 RepID=UPI001CCC0057|nr:ABC transporter ATP-binding protein [Mesorhizobium sp. BR1-1-16]MBZ9936893.1 ABC transporter ATP-binding protein [Mesorhizobium sp. BR1-1-16]
MLSKTPLLEIDNLVVDFETPGGTFNAVRGISLCLEQGGSHAIIGESGSGKSVTASAIMSLIDSPPGHVCGGDIRFQGRSILSMPRAERRRLYGRHIAMVFQDPAAHLNPVYPVGWQIAEVCRIHGRPAGEAKRSAIALMDRVGIGDAARRYHAFPHQFSGGQRQRIMIAMAMALRPELLIADEPTTALDVTVQAQILELIRELQQENGSALLLITHDLGVAADIARTVSVMRRGEFVEEGTIADVFVAPRHSYTQKLLEARTSSRPQVTTADAEVLLEVKDVSIDYGSVRAVSDVSLQLRHNEVLCVVGESGSGKSTIANAILRLREITSGSICYRGADIHKLGRAELDAYHRAVQAVFQDPFGSLNPRMSVFDIICEPWSIQRSVLPKSEWRQRSVELMESVGLTAGDLGKYPSEFSGGQRQRIAIARALALQSEIIVCDEAVSALDMTVQGQIISLLQEIRARMGVALLFITHDLTLVRNFADRVIVMKAGEIVEQGSTEDVFSNPKHGYTKMLLAACPVPDPVVQQERRNAAKVASGGNQGAHALARGA